MEFAPVQSYAVERDRRREQCDSFGLDQLPDPRQILLLGALASANLESDLRPVEVATVDDGVRSATELLKEADPAANDPREGVVSRLPAPRHPGHLKGELPLY